MKQDWRRMIQEETGSERVVFLLSRVTAWWIMYKCVRIYPGVLLRLERFATGIGSSLARYLASWGEKLFGSA